MQDFDRQILNWHYSRADNAFMAWFEPKTKRDVLKAKAMLDKQYDALPEFMQDFCIIPDIRFDVIMEGLPD